MNKDIRNFDEQGKPHGKEITYWSNGNIKWITNYNHGIHHGYLAFFNDDNSINVKTSFNMSKCIYNENHLNKQIEIKI